MAEIPPPRPGGSEGPRTRAKRVDARSNAESIVKAARTAFESGETPSLEELASRAGVGIATLYRHFPNREALVRAVYREIYGEQIVPQLAPESFLPAPYESFISISIQVIELLRTAPTANLAELTAELIQEHLDVFDTLLGSARDAGLVRPDLLAVDLPHIIGMVVVGLAVPGLTEAQRSRYLSLMFDGLTPGEPNELPPLA